MKYLLVLFILINCSVFGQNITIGIGGALRTSGWPGLAKSSMEYSVKYYQKISNFNLVIGYNYFEMRHKNEYISGSTQEYNRASRYCLNTYLIGLSTNIVDQNVVVGFRCLAGVVHSNNIYNYNFENNQLKIDRYIDAYYNPAFNVGLTIGGMIAKDIQLGFGLDGYLMGDERTLISASISVGFNFSKP